MLNRPRSSSVCITYLVLVEEGRYHDQDAPFPVSNHSDPTIWIGDLDPTGDGNQQTRDLSDAMP